MRMHAIGSELPRSWSPRFSPIGKDPEKSPAKKAGRVMSYYWTIKGERRPEKLMRTSHAVMAEILDADPEVIHWTSSPAPIRDHLSEDDGFTPTFLAELRGGRRRAVTILRFDRKDRAALDERQNTLNQMFGHMGVDIVILTEKELARHPMREAARHLFMFRSEPLPDGLLVDALTAVIQGDAPTLGDLQDHIDGLVTWCDILSLVGRGHIEIAWDGGLHRSTRILGYSSEGWAS